MNILCITFEVAENPSRDPITKHHDNGVIEIIFQITQEEMDEAIFKKLKKRFK